MKLNKSDAFLIHSVIFAYANSDVTFSEEDAAHLEELQSRLRDFVLQESEQEDCDECSHDEDEEESEEYDEEEDYDDEEEEKDSESDEPIELYVTPKSASDLQPMKVLSPDGSVVRLEFEDVGETDIVDVLLDGGSVIIDSVDKVVVNADAASFYDGEQWHDFKIVRLPKSWKKTFTLNTVTGFKGEE
jgi:hypothetical protein